MRQIVLDTETTGLEPELGHRIIEIGCVELLNRRPTGRTFHHYLNPDREIDKGYTLPMPRGWVVRENKWRAARYGMDADIIREDETTVPVRAALLELAHELKPAAERLGCVEELARVEQVVAEGSSYQRQRAAAAASGGDLTAVVDSLLAEFAAGRPLPLPVGTGTAPGAT